MSVQNSRRRFVQQMVGGAVILGFSPASRSWVTRASADDLLVALPVLDGTLQTTGLEPFAADFGRIISRQPRAVLHPGSINDIVKLVRFARRHGIKVAANGQAGSDDMRESHSNYGQSQVEAGVAIDMKTLATIHEIGADYIEVDAGVHWADVFDAALPTGLTPPVLTDYMHLSVGGTLSVGGIGGASQYFGVQADNVIALEVVTGRGDRVRCSADHEADLFNAVLAGAGQSAVIVRARLRLVPARAMATVFLLSYSDLNTYLADQRTLLLEGRFDYLEGQVVRRADDTGWQFAIEAATFYTPPEVPDQVALLAGLHDNRPLAQITTQTYRDFAFRLDPTVAFLKSIGVWQLPHPWLTVFVPASLTATYMNSVLPALTLANTGQGPILFYPVKTHQVHRPLFRLPDQPIAFHLSILRTGSPDPVVTGAMLAQNRTLYDLARQLDGTRYIIGAIPNFTPHDWQRHYGPVWDFLVRSKRHFDPDNVLTPGQGIFPEAP
jgi:cytokinin dehydrogenase